MKRAPAWKALEKALYGVKTAKVLRSGALRNAAGKHDDGWQVRAEDGEDLFTFVAIPESGLRTFGRVLGRRYDLVLDVMLGKDHVASLVMHREWTNQTGTGQLVDLEKNEIVSLEAWTRMRARVTQGGHPLPLLTFHATRHSTSAMCGKRHVADVHVLKAGTLIPRVDGYSARFDDTSTPFERLLTTVAITFADLHAVRPTQDRPDELHRLFGDD